MLRLQMLPAGCGDCLWLEYGTPPDNHIIIIDGGLKDTSKVLETRIKAACLERGTDTLHVDLLIVTHIDNDHILGIIELLRAMPHCLNINDIWFNGRPQLMKLPTPNFEGNNGYKSPIKAHGRRPSDLLGVGTDDASNDGENPAGDNGIRPPSAADLLGSQQGDDLSVLLERHNHPWNKNKCWEGSAVMIPETGKLPCVALKGNLTLTLLGPTHMRLYNLCTAWSEVLGGTDERSKLQVDTLDDLLGSKDLLGHRDTWPPVWKKGENKDSSRANGSSIMLLAEYEGCALLLPGDGYASDMAIALKRLHLERGIPSTTPFHLEAFKLSHHGSANNITRELIEQVDCSHYLISTDGSGYYRHPDHQALLCILRYSKKRPELLFNYETVNTISWSDSKSDIVKIDNIQDYDSRFPVNPADGLVLDIN